MLQVFRLHQVQQEMIRGLIRCQLLSLKVVPVVPIGQLPELALADRALHRAE
jgi:hypothetical protein